MSFETWYLCWERRVYFKDLSNQNLGSSCCVAVWKSNPKPARGVRLLTAFWTGSRLIYTTLEINIYIHMCTYHKYVFIYPYDIIRIYVFACMWVLTHRDCTRTSSGRSFNYILKQQPSKNTESNKGFSEALSLLTLLPRSQKVFKVNAFRALFKDLDHYFACVGPLFEVLGHPCAYFWGLQVGSSASLAQEERSTQLLILVQSDLNS